VSKPAETRDRPTPLQWFTRLAPYAVWGADLDFVHHRERNADEIPSVTADLDEGVRSRLEEDRELALSGGSAVGRRLRVYVPLSIALLGSAAMLGSLIHMAVHWSEHPRWLVFVALPVAVSQAVAAIGFWVYQGLFRESVVRHEVRQVLVTLVLGGVPDREASDYQLRLRLAWRLRRLQDTALALAALVTPIAGAALFPLAFLRSAGSLAQHALHEESLGREVAQAQDRAT
jgi:hypothetical protein